MTIRKSYRSGLSLPYQFPDVYQVFIVGDKHEVFALVPVEVSHFFLVAFMIELVKKWPTMTDCWMLTVSFMECLSTSPISVIQTCLSLDDEAKTSSL